MQTTTKRLNAYTIELLIQESSRELEKARISAIADLRANAKIKGFRPGSDIPREIIEREYGAEMINDRALDHYLRGVYTKILTKEKISAIGAGELQRISFEPFEIVINIETVPEITIDESTLDAIQLTRTPVTVTPADVDEYLRNIEKHHTTYRPATDGETIETGDRATISTQGYEGEDGALLPDTRVDDFGLVIGSGQFIPGFEEKLVGHTVDEEVKFNITFPADYHAEAFKSKEVFFVTKVNGLEKSVRPEMTVEFIEKITQGACHDVEALHQRVTETIRADRDHETRSVDEDKLLDRLVELAKPEIGP